MVKPKRSPKRPQAKHKPKRSGSQFDVHHHPTPGPADGQYMFGHNWVSMCFPAQHSMWGVIALPLRSLLYVRAVDVPDLKEKYDWQFRTKLEMAVELVTWLVGVVRQLGMTCQIWCVADGAYAARVVIRPLLKQGVTVFSRLRKDANLRDLPPAPKPNQRGRHRIYGHNRITLRKRASHRDGWETLCTSTWIMIQAVKPASKRTSKSLSTRPVTRWDGRTTKIHPVTCDEIPDETARVQELRYLNPRKSHWPEAAYIVGNPPFIGDKRMRQVIGTGYVDAIRKAHEELPESIEFVMYWWWKAAIKIRAQTVKQFGFITTNSIGQSFNRRVVEPLLGGELQTGYAFAIPDHPWVDANDGASVRIAMTVVRNGIQCGTLQVVVQETRTSGVGARVQFRTSMTPIRANLRGGADLGSASPMQANSGLSSNGFMLAGSGFILQKPELDNILNREPDAWLKVIHPYLGGRDLTQVSRKIFLVDFFPMHADEAVRRFPVTYQWVLDRVKPIRDQNNRQRLREIWWQFGEPRKTMRSFLAGLPRYIATTETAKHRFFVFLPRRIAPDHMLIVIGSDEGFVLGVLSSKLHVQWALATGGRLGVGNDPRYNKSVCFETFPFPVAIEALAKRIGDLAERLDSHRKQQQAQYPALTMTGMYNVLEKLRSGEPLTAKEHVIHEQGLVSLLMQIHDDLDAAVFDAYGWPHDIDDEEILQRLVNLNHERADEESRGIVR